jgi:hypothetical protein
MRPTVPTGTASNRTAIAGSVTALVHKRLHGPGGAAFGSPAHPSWPAGMGMSAGEAIAMAMSVFVSIARNEDAANPVARITESATATIRFVSMPHINS